MNLTEKHYKQLLYIAECLSCGLNSMEIRAEFGKGLLQLLDADYYASYIWNSVDRRFEKGVSINMGDTNLMEYNRYYQFHDPITYKLKMRRRASCVSRVIDQADLQKTEFFNDFLSLDGLFWGINLYAYDGRENIGDIRIWRRKSKANFDELSECLLEMVRPHFTNSLCNARNYERVFQADEPLPLASTNGDVFVSWDADLCLNKFGLTPREIEIVREVLRGKNDQQIADELCIAYSTVRSHIKHIFKKVGVHNRLSLSQRVSSV